jgi:hypothetical protein
MLTTLTTLLINGLSILGFLGLAAKICGNDCS